MSKVYAPHQPSKYDRTVSEWLPTINLEPATKFGKLEILLPPNANLMHAGPLVTALSERMKDYSRDDYLIAVGDPTLFAAAAVIAYRQTGRLRMLKWDRMASDYFVVEFPL